MKGLIYPLAGIAAVVICVCITAAVLTAISDARKARAIHHAKWEPFVDIKGDGKAEIGVRQIARWGRHSKVLHTDKRTEAVDVDDVFARVSAYTEAQTRAESYNQLDATTRTVQTWDNPS